MNEIQIFKNDSFGAVRTTTDENGKILFCGKDVATALGYSNVPDALSRHCRCIVKCDVPHPQSPSKTIEMSFITEGDVYRLTFGSKLPSAEKFTDWVADEILPSIRKHGAYMTENVIEQALTSPDFLIQLATQLKEEQAQRKALEQRVEADRPKVLFADAVETSQTSILVGDLAKLIKQNGVDIGQKRLFAWLRDNGYLIKSGSSTNMPTQRSMDMKLFEVKERSISNPDGSVRVTKTTKVTGKGQTYFINIFLKGA
ncbi:phage antirepressor [Ruminococcus flavefaciens]|uniref:phage antirepressor n=1 Tax=Ruminococcus flavefaciens TaxID=1265 RepID=UPI0026EABBB7|nr:phage antirepressor [Ruminococcus flavefaciens]